MKADTKELTRNIRNARRRLARMKDRRANGPEAREALVGSPLAMEFTAYLDGKIPQLQREISKLEARRTEVRNA